MDCPLLKFWALLFSGFAWSAPHFSILFNGCILFVALGSTFSFTDSLFIESFESYTFHIHSCTSHKYLKELKYPNTFPTLIIVLSSAMTPPSQTYCWCRHNTSFTCNSNDLVLNIVPPHSPSCHDNNLVLHHVKPFTLLTTPH